MVQNLEANYLTAMHCCTRRIHYDPGVEFKKRERYHPSLMVKRRSDLACQKQISVPWRQIHTWRMVEPPVYMWVCKDLIQASRSRNASSAPSQAGKY